MTRFIKAIYHANIKTAQFITDDNRVLLRTGGSLPWRICNGGDLSSPLTDGKPTPRKTRNYIGFANPENSKHHFFIFPDYQTGRAELKASLRRLHNEKTLAKLVESYAPKKDGNNTEKYIKDLSAESGVGRDTKLKELNDNQLGAVMDGIEKLEGYHRDKETRKEVWTTITHIQATDGKRPIAGEEIIVRSAGKETAYKSNAAGLFPPISHGNAPAEVHHKAADGTTRKLADLSPEKGARLVLSSKSEEVVGTTAPVKAPENPVSGKHGFLYTVQPGDYLSKIAVRFKHLNVTVQRIKQDNQLTKDALMPGQVLGINMAPPGRIPPTPPKQAAKPAPKATAQPAPAAKNPPARKPAVPPEVNTQAARSKDGKGEALALKAPEDGLVPWMKYAIAEAKQFKGAEEDQIEKTVNYHTDIKDGRKSLVGTLNAWCAAYVNWCLMHAGYPIRNPSENGYTDQAADTGRANGFRMVSMKEEIPESESAGTGAKKGKAKKKYRVFKVDNPLYVKIDSPVYGAIGIVTGPGGHGHHAGFVYGRAGKNKICLLGGNQGQTINFSPFLEKETTVEAKKKGGKVIKKKTDHLEFYLPVSYMPYYEKNSKDLNEVDCDKLNSAIGIAPPKDKNTVTTTR
jgi:LysM repeat protein